MTETAETINTTLSATPDQVSDVTSKAVDLNKEESVAGGISLRIWPPTQKTRNAVLKRLVETFSTKSILSKRFGTLNSDEASAVAKSIEEEAYGVASNAVSDGIKILEVYSKEISKRMLETVKDRSAATETNNEAVEDLKSDVTEDDEAPESEKNEA